MERCESSDSNSLCGFDVPQRRRGVALRVTDLDRVPKRHCDGCSLRLGPMMIVLAREADEDRDARVTRDEWERYCKSQLVGGDFVVRRLEGRRVAPMAGSLILGRLDADGSTHVSLDEALALFPDLDLDANGVLEQQELVAKPPRPAALSRGLVAPDFDLPYVGETKVVADSRGTVRLSSFRGKRPVALIFGSYT